MTTPQRNPELESAIAAAPDDASSYAAYGAWLRAQGAPHGELVAIQLALASDPDNQPLLDAELALLEQHAEVFFGPSPGNTQWIPQRGWGGFYIGYPYKTSRWRNGFMYELEFADRAEGVEPVLRRFLAVPAARFLQRVTLGEVAAVDFGSGYPEALAALAQAPCRDTLWSLKLEDPDADGDATCRSLVEADIVSRLREVVLQLDQTTDEGARMLLDHRDKLAHLDRLEIWGRLSESVTESLASVAKEVEVVAIEDEEDDEDDGYDDAD